MRKWMVVIPPSGAARTQGLSIARTLGQLSNELGSSEVVDSRSYLDALPRLLRNPQDQDLVVDLFNQTLLCKILEKHCNRLLVPALAPVSAYYLQLLRNQRVRTTHWFFEDYRQATYWEEVFPAYDLFCAIQRGPVERACRSRCQPYLYLPNATAYTPPTEIPTWHERTYDLCFVGLPSTHRIGHLETLQHSGLSLAVAGQGWENYHGPLQQCIVQAGWTPPDLAARLYLDSRMVINLCMNDPGNEAPDDQISPRAYDAVAHGAALLTERLGQNPEALAGITYHEFRGPTDLLQLARRLATQGTPGNSQAENLQAISQRHLMVHRLRQMSSTLDALFPR